MIESEKESNTFFSAGITDSEKEARARDLRKRARYAVASKRHAKQINGARLFNSKTQMKK